MSIVCCCASTDCRINGCQQERQLREKHAQPQAPIWRGPHIVNPPQGEPFRSLTEGDVRRIVREELANAPKPAALQTFGGQPVADGARGGVVKHEVRLLEGELLNEAVAKANGWVKKPHAMLGECWAGGLVGGIVGIAPASAYKPSSEWGQGGPIMNSEKLDAFWNEDAGWWSVSGWDERAGREVVMRDPSWLVAGMRCYVACKLGAEVELP